MFEQGGMGGGMMHGGGMGSWGGRGSGRGGRGEGQGGPGAWYGRMAGIDDEGGGTVYDHQVVMRLLAYIRPYWRRMLLSFAAMMAYTATVVALPKIVQVVIDDYIDAGDLSGLNLVALVFVGVAVFQFATNYLHMRMLAFVGQGVLLTLRMDLFRHLQRLSMSFFDRNESGKVMSRLQNDVQQLQELTSMVTQTAANVLSLLGIIAIMFWMNVQLALITLTVIPLLLIVLKVWQKFAKSAFLRARTTIAEVNAGLQENISGVRVVQSLNRERANIARFGEANYDNLEANMGAMRYTAVLAPSVEILTALGLALVVYFGGSLVMDKSIEVGVLVAFALYIQRFFEPVRMLSQEYGQFQRAMASGTRIFELMDVDPEVKDSPDAVELPPLKGDVGFEGVAFHYDEDSPVLQDVELRIRPGEMVALVGPTGAGKTTIASLLMRLYDVTDGRITADGHDLRDVTLDSLTGQISIVPQEPYLFSDSTVAENIRYNRTDTSDEAVVTAAKAVGAHDFIMELPEGYDTPLQERGGNLSMGQRQLISFARALAADPRILILDEATANIDTETEMAIQKALGRLLKDRTSLVIAHRLSTIRNADRIIVLEGGRVVQQGTHEELMVEGEGLYAKLQSYTSDGPDDGRQDASHAVDGDGHRPGRADGRRRRGPGEGRRWGGGGPGGGQRMGRNGPGGGGGDGHPNGPPGEGGPEGRAWPGRRGPDGDGHRGGRGDGPGPHGEGGPGGRGGPGKRGRDGDGEGDSAPD